MKANLFAKKLGRGLLAPDITRECGRKEKTGFYMNLYNLQRRDIMGGLQ